MSQQARSLLNLSFVAAAAVSAYRGVDFNGAQITTQGANIAGFAKRPAAQGEPFEAAAIGTATAETGAAITAGQRLQMDNQGRVIPADNLTVAAGATQVTSSSANGAILAGGVLPEAVVAVALESASGAGKFIEVMRIVG